MDDRRYDPEKYLKMYQEAEGSSSQEKINSIRREQYAGEKDEINARKRGKYAERKGLKPEGKAGNINLTENGDVWIVDYSDGIRPTKDELSNAFDICEEESKRTIAEDPNYDRWTFEERYYMRGREKMFRLGNLFEWRVMGGHIDEQ